MPWEVVQSADQVHVIPDADLEPHFKTVECHCHQEWHPHTTETVIVHNSFDQREYHEPDSTGVIN